MPVIPVIAAIGSVASAGSAIANAVGGGKNKGGETVTAEQMIPDFQQKSGQQLSDWVTKYLPNFEPGTPYSGKLTTEATSQEQTSLDMLTRLLGQSPTGDLFSAGKGQIMDTLSGKFANPETSPFIQSMTKMANQNLQDQITQERGQRGARGTYFTKAGINAEGTLKERTSNNLQSIIGSFIQDERNRQFQAAPIAQVLDQYGNITAPESRIAAGQAYGGLQRTIDLSNIEKQYRDYLQQRTEKALPVAAAQSLYGTQQPYGLKSVDMPVQEQNSTLGNILGLVGKLNTSGLSSGNNIWQNISGLFSNMN